MDGLDSPRKAARHELRKAQTLDLLAEVLASQEAHGREMRLWHAAITEHTEHQVRLSGSFWARMKWLMVGH